MRRLLPYIATTAALVLLVLSLVPVFHPTSGTAQIEKRFWHAPSKTTRTLTAVWGRGLFGISYKRNKISHEDFYVLRYELKKFPPQWRYLHMRDDVGPIVRPWWFVRYPPSSRTWGFSLGARTWPVTLLSGVVALLCLRRMVAASRRRRMPNLCQVCGYDLRATPERCPECGMLGRQGA